MTGPISNFARSLELQERLHRLIPGGSHTYSKGEDQFPSLSPRVIARADGARCWDVDGNCFVDWAMGTRALILGHNYPAVNEAVRCQLEVGMNFTRPSILEVEVAEFLVDFWPWAEMVKFGKNGSDVTSAAVKLARAGTGRQHIAYCADHPFFSIHDWFISTTPSSAGTLEAEAAFTHTFRYNDLESVEQVFAEHPGQVAAIILEPVKNDEPRDDFLHKLREVTRREGTVLIFDEMISGMKFDVRGAHHLFGVEPDLATFGKAIANGFSFSCLVGRRDLMELGGLRHDRRRVFLLSQTHGAEATGLAACRATVQECLRLDVTRHVWEMGGRLARAVRDEAASLGVAGHVRVEGFDCNPQIVCTDDAGAVWPELSTLFHEEVISHGVLIPWTTVTWSHRDDEFTTTMTALRAGMQRVRDALSAGRVSEALTGPAVKPVFRPFNRCRQARCGRLHRDAPRLSCCTEAP